MSNEMENYISCTDVTEKKKLVDYLKAYAWTAKANRLVGTLNKTGIWTSHNLMIFCLLMPNQKI
jgi:hypothetical protein